MTRRLSELRRATLLALLSTWTCSINVSTALDAHANVGGDAHAKSIAVLRLTFPTRGEVWRIRLSTSRDGEEFHAAGFGLLGGRDLFRSVAYDGDRTTVLVPALGWYGTDASFFGGPGIHWFRWETSFRDQTKPRTVADQLGQEHPIGQGGTASRG